MYCNECKQEKPEYEFGKFYKTRKSGERVTFYRKVCKECFRKKHDLLNTYKEYGKVSRKNLTDRYIITRLSKKDLPKTPEFIQLLRQLSILKKNIKLLTKIVYCLFCYLKIIP